MDSKSGQFKVRTPPKEKPSQLRLPEMRRRGVERFQSRKCSSQNRMISSCRFRKSGQFKVRTPPKEKPSQLRLPEMRRRGVERFQSRKCSSQNRVISICRFRKSGQFKVRTQESKKLCRLHSRRDQQKKNMGTCSFGSRRIGNAEIFKFQTQKADSLRSAPHFRKTPILAAF
jgi:hypothetical protein